MKQDRIEHFPLELSHDEVHDLTVVMHAALLPMDFESDNLAAACCTVLSVMVCSPILHIALNPRSRLQWLNPFPMLSDRPPTPLGRRPASHSLSWTLVCFYHPSLLDILDSP